MKRFFFLMFVLAVGCGGKAAKKGGGTPPNDDAETLEPTVVLESCAPGETRETEEACGLNRRGTFLLECAGDRWLATCGDPDECREGATRLTGERCEDEGLVVEACIEGHYEPSECQEEAACPPGSERLGEPCAAGGQMLEVCDDDGEWQASGVCEDPECEPGDEAVSGLPCGLNGRGEWMQVCIDGRFQTSGECRGSDVCEDDVVQSTAGCSRTCVEGQWHDEQGCHFCGETINNLWITVETNDVLEAQRGVKDLRGALVIR
jgi:hypothetical protein